jgi:glutathione S-transferase
MALKLHRCSATWIKLSGHPCWRVQKALDRAGIEYEVVRGPLSRGKRERILALSGQRLYPVLELEDGRIYREDSRKMAERIRAGKLHEAPAVAPGDAG